MATYKIPREKSMEYLSILRYKAQLLDLQDEMEINYEVTLGIRIMLYNTLKPAIERCDKELSLIRALPITGEYRIIEEITG